MGAALDRVACLTYHPSAESTDMHAEIGACFRRVQAWVRELGHDQDEFRRQTDLMRPVLDPETILFVDVDGKTVAFGLGLPNVNEALHHANGLRRPWDYVRFLWDRRHITGEDNPQTNKLVKVIGAKVYKKYRIYQLEI